MSLNDCLLAAIKARVVTGRQAEQVQKFITDNPDMPERDPRGANEAGFPYDEGYTQVNPAYFDMADLRIPRITCNWRLLRMKSLSAWRVLT